MWLTSKLITHTNLPDTPTDDESAAHSILSFPLRQILRGPGIVYIGTLLGLLLAFVSRLLIARVATEAQYGVYSLGLAIATIIALVAMVGLSGGLSRNIAVARARKEDWKVREYVLASFAIVTLISIQQAAGLFLSSGFICNNIFHQTELAIPLRIFAAAIPLLALLNLGVACFRASGVCAKRLTSKTFCSMSHSLHF